MKIKDILPKIKANRHTFYNLDQKTIQVFKIKYRQLKRRSEIEVLEMTKNEVEKILSMNEPDFLKKIWVINTLLRLVK